MQEGCPQETEAHRGELEDRMELPKVRQPISGRIGTRSERSKSPSLAWTVGEVREGRGLPGKAQR